MDSIFKTWTTSRKLYSKFFDDYSLDQLNEIPNGFNNNLIWNIGHIIVSQQALIYKNSNLPMYISDEFVHLYKPGTKPERRISQSEADEIKALLLSLVAKTKEDFQKDLFPAYPEKDTLTGFHLGSLKEAFEFVNYHEGIHLGYMMSIRKFV